MDQSQGTICQKLANAARAFETRRTGHGREWVAVFLNEDTIVVALHGSLSTAEKALAQSPAGTAQVREFHRHLFANLSAPLLQTIKNLTGMKVRYTIAEIDSTTDSVMQIFTTDTVADEFLFIRGGLAGTRVPGHGALPRSEYLSRNQQNRTCHPKMIARVSPGCVVRR